MSHTPTHRRWTRLLALGLAGLFLIPSSASSNYLYEVLPPELHPYVLLIVDNSGSMLCQDGLYDDKGRRTNEGLYQSSDQACHANYCRTKTGSSAWVCPTTTTAQFDAGSFPTCDSAIKGPFCDNTQESCKEICDVPPCTTPCETWGTKPQCTTTTECARMDKRKIPGTCVTPCLSYKDVEDKCTVGPCKEWNKKQVCDRGECTRRNLDNCRNTDQCETYKQVWVPQSGGVCTRWDRREGPTKCTSADCKNQECRETKQQCTDTTTCEIPGEKYNCRTEYYNCKDDCRVENPGTDNEFTNCDYPKICQERQVCDQYPCQKYKQNCTNVCTEWRWDQCMEKTPVVPGYWQTTSECATFKRECTEGTCAEYQQINCRMEDNTSSCKVPGDRTCTYKKVCDKYGPEECQWEDYCAEFKKDCVDVPDCKKWGPQQCGCRQSCVKVPTECDCPSRMETAQSVLQTLIPGLDNLTLGLARYGKFEPGGPREKGMDGDVKNCGVRIESPLPGDRAEILNQIDTMIPEGGTPIAKSLVEARKHLEAVAADDPAASCRKYFVILVTDGEESCAPNRADLENAVSELRQLRASDTVIDVRTFILGFGPELAGDDLENHSLSKLARLGGTAEVDGKICEPTVGEPCDKGAALFALRRHDLVAKLRAAFSEITRGEFSAVAPVIGTAPQTLSEAGRVARNLLVYSTFRQPGFSGHLYGIRLFRENSKTANDWDFTDLSKLELNECGQKDDNPCLFDAGDLLTRRSKPRRIFTGLPTRRVDDLGGVLLPLEDGDPVSLSNDHGGYDAFGDTFEAYADLIELEDLLSEGKRPPNLPAEWESRLVDLPSNATDRAAIVRWLHGDGREWKLADIYHGGPAIVGAPPYDYRTRGYDRFKNKLRRRPEMIYVGANDGMIHAFHAAPKLFSDEQYPWREHEWTAGEEEWAYLPVNMLARASQAILDANPDEPRFFSQDLSCRIDDVLVKDNLNEDGELDCGNDEYCGWRTVLLCGQGWGGSWLVALDVSDPFNPKPMWESTVDDLGEGSNGVGRTWSVPSVALFNFATSLSSDARPSPVWAAVYGSGYNADTEDLYGNSYPGYRLLNLPFDGAFAYHGNGTSGEKPHVFVQNLANGHLLEVFHQHESVNFGAVVADIPLLDVDGDGFTDVAYVGGWESQLGRIAFSKVTAEDGTLVMPPRTHPSAWSNSCSVFSFEGTKPITNAPTAVPDPTVNTGVYLFAGAGVDRGSFPDEQKAELADYGIRGFYFSDDGSKECPSAFADEGNPGTPISNDGNLCEVDDEGGAVKLSGIMASNSRLLGSPLLSLQPNHEKWLSFTAWNPDKSTCSDGTASLYCLNVNDNTRCVPCAYQANSEGGPSGAKIDLGEVGQKLPSPVSADGQLYVVGPDGIMRVGNQSGGETGISGSTPVANQSAPKQVIVSWREIFEL